MITTVTLNAAVDITYYLPKFELNKLNRTTVIHKEPGGKGINVAKVINALGEKVITTGFVGGFNGERIQSGVEKLGINSDFIKIDSESRLCINIIDEGMGSQTEILEHGPTILEVEWTALCNKVSYLSKNSEFVVLSGSLPKGLNNNCYKELITLIKENKAKAIIDTSGSPLEQAIEASPYMIKPNKGELAQLLKKDTINHNDIVDALSYFKEKGVVLTVVSLGEEGALVGYDGSIMKVIPPQIDLVNAVGCGDAMVAGITAGLQAKQSIMDALSLGAAAAAANAQESRAGRISVELLKSLRKQVKIE